MNNLSAWKFLALFAVAGLASVCAYAQETDPDTLLTPFLEHGQITIQLSAGEHRIIGSENDQIRIRWRGEDVEATTDVEGSTAKIELDGPRQDFRTVIEVPRHSGLIIRLSAGELAVEKVIGDKDIRLRAGELSIEVGEGDEYSMIEGSLWAGDIDARALGHEASGLFRSIDWVGEGEHELSFHVYAGDVTLY